MNKKSQRNTFQAPTTQPVVAIAPSGTVTVDGELPHSASNGVTAPEPLAAHDVLHAAMAHPDATSTMPAPDADHDTAAVNDPDMPSEASAVDSPALDAGSGEAPRAKNNKRPGKMTGKTTGKKAGKSAGPDSSAAASAATSADPLTAAIAPKVKPPKDKFVACNFTLPQSEAAVLSAMKKTHQANGVNVKKSQLLRAALLHLANVDSSQLAQLLAQLPEPPVAPKKKK